MQTGIKNIIILIIGFFFLLSASEVSTSFVKNTFNDDYDSYVLPDNSHSTHLSVKIFTDLILAAPPVTIECITQEKFFSFNAQYADSLCSSPPIYLKNRILLI